MLSIHDEIMCPNCMHTKLLCNDLTLVDCPTQLTLIFILWYLYVSAVFYDKYEGKSANLTLTGSSYLFDITFHVI